ncbi:MAG: ATPase, T2SS/T4P/T4SS family [Tissierellia bacterium]|nr:ATPase, T2SS/T4P/T4SS family [Tissierellia bacterium]
MKKSINLLTVEEKFQDEKLIYGLKLTVLKEKSIMDMTDEKLEIFINKSCVDYLKSIDEIASFDRVIALSQQVFYRIRGYGFLENFLSKPQVTEIMVNDINSIFIEENGTMKKLDYRIESLEEYYRIINKIVSRSGREVNLSNPIVDARLEDGSRVNVVLPPIAKDQPALTIRRFPEKVIDIDYLIKSRTLSQEAANFLEKLVKSGYNIMISGGTSSGKTSLLNALSEFIDPQERIISIEDSRELRLIDKPNLVSLESRNSNNSKRGEIQLKDLIKTSLRMRPDRIIVGEVRGQEALDMLQAYNTGHSGSLTTGHANSCRDMISRLETMVLQAGDNIPLEAVKRMIASAINIVIQVSKLAGNKRRLVEISELYFSADEIKINPLYLFDYKEDKIYRTENEMINVRKFKNIYEK